MVPHPLMVSAIFELPISILSQGGRQLGLQLQPFGFPGGRIGTIAEQDNFGLLGGRANRVRQWPAGPLR